MNTVSYQKAYEYQLAARRTFAELDSRKLEVAHMMMGMCGEINELYEAVANNDVVGIGEELTDIQWFLANHLFSKNIYPLMFDLEIINDQDFPTEHADPLHGLMISISKLTDNVKKIIIYDKGTSQEYITNIGLVVKYSIMLYNKYGLDIGKCMENNINKLKIRFPEKFNAQLAINRDHEKERVALEQ
jgi:NTP pyrophosphatase (non-canonical NTP hydrolase)